MALLKMLVTKQASKEGILVETFLAGETYDLQEPLASMLVHSRFAEAVEPYTPPVATPAAPAAVTAAETKAQGAARAKALAEQKIRDDAVAEEAAAVTRAAEQKAFQAAPENKMLTLTEAEQKTRDADTVRATNDAEARARQATPVGRAR